MDFDINDLENSIFNYIDRFKVLLSSETWENILLNSTKNEMFVLMILYRGSDVNMSQIADYLNAPLNTTTGIVSRMEKKKMLSRVRSTYDKRVVTIVLTDEGKKQITDIMALFLELGQRLFSSLDGDEMSVLLKVIDKILDIVEHPKESKEKIQKKVRKIKIE